MSAFSEISTVHPALPDAEDTATDAMPAALHPWPPADVPQARPPTPTALVILAVCAGVGALVLGVLAGVSTLSGAKESSDPAVTTSAADAAERQALSLLAKPSTERIVFRGSAGRLLLAVGSAGRAAILIRGLDPAVPGRKYGAWIVGTGRPMRAARFAGTERAVFLTAPLGPRESVVVSQSRPTSLASAQLVALRS